MQPKQYLIKFLLAALVLSVNTLSAQTDYTYKVISSFYQQDASNCASIALIKAAMSKYGHKNMFTWRMANGHYKIELHNGIKLSITNDELEQASQMAGFGTADVEQLPEADSVLFYAHLSYACSAKFIETKGYWGCEDDGSPHFSAMLSYKKALRFISKTSFCTDNAYRLLGLSVVGGKCKDFSSTNPLPDSGILLYSNGHAVTAYKNQLDCYGDWLPIEAGKICHQKFKWYLELDKLTSNPQ